MRAQAKHPIRDAAGMAGAEHREQRYIYSGDGRRMDSTGDLPRNRRGIQRRVSTFNILLVLFGFAVGIVLYVNSIIVVNQLALEVSQLQTAYAKKMNENAELQAEVNRKSARERIGPMAIEQLGLQYTTDPIVVFPLDAGLQKKAGEIDRRMESRTR